MPGNPRFLALLMPPKRPRPTDPAAPNLALVRRLALALGPVKAVIRVVDRSPKPMSVNWAAVGKDEKGHDRSISFTDFAGGHIAVNPLPLIEGHREALDIVTGFGLHEASHCQEGTKDRFAVLIERVPEPDGRGFREKPVLRPLRVAVYLLNLADDVRVEGRTAHHWPGFGHYFETVLRYLWKEPESISGDSPGLVAQLRVAWYTIRYGERAKEVREALRADLPGSLVPGPAGLTVEGADFDAEYDFWRTWVDDYLSASVDTLETVKRGLNHLVLDEQTAREMEALTESEQREEAAGEKIRAQIERLMRDGIAGAPGVCITEDGEVQPLTNAEAAAVDQLVREGLVAARPLIIADGDTEPEMTISKPLESSASKGAYIGRPTPLVEALRTSLVFRAAAPQHDLKLQERGVMDDEELWRPATGDYRVFSERIIEARPDTALGLLVDISGSMAGGKLAIAQRLAQTFVWATQDLDGVTSTVWAHTSGTGAEVFRIWQPGDPLTRLGLLSSLDHASNADGYAIGWCVSQLLPQPEPQKVLIVLSDGLPSFYDYGGNAGMAHVRRVVDWADRQGVTVIQIAIDPGDMRPEEQAAMFGPNKWVPYTDDASLPRDLARVVGRLTQ